MTRQFCFWQTCKNIIKSNNSRNNINIEVFFYLTIETLNLSKRVDRSAFFLSVLDHIQDKDGHKKCPASRKPCDFLPPRLLLNALALFIVIVVNLSDDYSSRMSYLG